MQNLDHQAFSETENRNVFGNLTMPHPDFVNYISQLEIVFGSSFNSLAISEQVGCKLKEKLTDITYTHVCPYFPYEYFLSLFVPTRIFYTLKFANREFQVQKSQKHSSKIVILQHL